ncbi:cytoplasmic protein [Cryptococcus deuterogattii 99/473]|uniref:Cytoplasmic protein n=1 Tax=Cryptococcus deuterogattii Ram5 TaxID=1296110 RepID=A0A0D0UW59_9TREE|nr:cytoplasmic protein [Cryptococcus deuterogattii LA55]KIR38374.1 cytoplasmic protein [Cryptococcus deuterogattii Ram5]KIR69674.1 cytoplasmic protein [Cryptococcus deuterogattii CA1014]KIR89621.1 cytoplasmic protein [Cryptococcus deuterogattii CBS 10090]KIY54383.1 cytoplasmic protein [Cryptococcus deuterogattii 99/473]
MLQIRWPYTWSHHEVPATVKDRSWTSKQQEGKQQQASKQRGREFMTWITLGIPCRGGGGIRQPHVSDFPASITMGQRSNSNASGASSTSAESEAVNKDELDRLGYRYSLRVAVLHHHLLNAALSPCKRLSSSSMSHRSHPSGASVPPLASPPATGISPNGSRFTSLAYNTPPHTPEPSSPSTPPPILRRKSSAWVLGKHKNDGDAVKLPKDFLLEFWGTLGAEEGDLGWESTVKGFTSIIKKGSKTASGLNLREIPTLLEGEYSTIHESHRTNSRPVFSSYIPPAGPGCAAKHVHQSHFLQLLYNVLPRSSYFSPMTRTQTEKEKELLARLRTEVQSYMLSPSPLPNADTASSGLVTPGKKSSVGIGRPTGQDSVRRKPSPVWDGDVNEMMNTVGQVWGVRKETLDRDVSEITSGKTSIEQFPDLATPVPATDYDSPMSPRGDASNTFFTPPRTVEVFGRLATRAAEAGHGSKTRDLLERCREVWGISSKREKEKEIEELIARWEGSIATKEEFAIAKNIADGIGLIAIGLRPGDPLPAVLSQILNRLLEMASKSLASIFPTTSSTPLAPPPSLLLIFNSSPELFASQPEAAKVLDNLSDEVKASAIGDILDPASIIIKCQLPLFLAEIHSLEKPRGSASDIFTLYEITGKLLDLWDDLSFEQDHGFDLDGFFEPHVRAWLKDTEANRVGQWVERSVGMDSWVPEGENRHSQSVIDLFEFVRGSAQVILHELPLSEYKRAVYLIDYSRTVSYAVNQYASIVLGLFMRDMNPVKAPTPASELQGKLGGKAGSWFAKGQQAVKNLERKKIEGFLIPPAACVKLTDMGAAKTCLEDMSFAMEAEDTARIIKAHHLSGAQPDKAIRHLFAVTILRGENLLGKGLVKAADGFVVVLDKQSGERCIKTKTVLGTEDPKWDQSFEISVGAVKILELQVYDRQLVGKHDLIGISTFKLDPRLFADYPTRDVVLPLNPRGTVHVRISMEGGEKHDVQYHLDAASRICDRAAEDMVREIVDKMGEFIKAQLSVATIQTLTKPLKDKKRTKTALTEHDIEYSLGLLFEYLNENFSIFSVTLTFNTRIGVMLAIWHRIIEITISLLVPPLSDKPYLAPPLPPQEVDIIFRWLQLLKSFFNAAEDGTELGVPLSQLQSGPYKDIIMLGQYMDLPTPTLKERCSAAVRAAGAGRSGGLSNGMKGSSLEGNDNERMAEVLLRIARTRWVTAFTRSCQS